MNYLTMFVIVAVSTACSSPDPNGFRVAPKLSAVFDAAAMAWCDAGGPCAYQDTDGTSNVWSVEVLDRPNTRGSIDYLDDGAAMIRILAGLDPITELTVLTHELGHHFGCKHSENPNDIMFFYAVDGVTLPDAADVACAR
jgi:hypothetical protein